MILTILTVIYLMIALAVFVILGALSSASGKLSKKEYKILCLASIGWPVAAIYAWWKSRG